MLSDLRHLTRSLRRSPATAAAAVLTLSLTLGAGTALYALLDAVLLTPPPFADPDALVLLGEVPRDDLSASLRAVSYATVQAWTDRGREVLAAVIAAIGLFGVMAHTVASRRSELALRLALGAAPERLLRSVLVQAALMVGPGIAIGLLLSASASNALANVLFEIGPHDPLTFLVVASLLTGIAILAAVPPARRAARTDPIHVLRGE